MLDAPRFAGWANLEIRKLSMYRAYYGYVKRLYGDVARPLMTGFDSMILHIQSDIWPALAMQKANGCPGCPVRFDLSKLFKECPNKGKLGCFKIEEGEHTIYGCVFLKAKMYVLRMLSADRVEHNELKRERYPQPHPQHN